MSTLYAAKARRAVRRMARYFLTIICFWVVWSAGALLHKAVDPLCESILEAVGGAWPVVIVVSVLIVLAFHNKA